MATMALALAGCASDGYYSQYPGETYYDGGSYGGSYYEGPYYPYYGSGYGYGYDDYDSDDDRYVHPAHNVTCDRARDICYDRYGPSYQATKRYFGERDANRSYKKYGDRVFLFSPSPGVTCDRRTDDCSNRKGADFSSKEVSPARRLSDQRNGDDDPQRMTPLQQHRQAILNRDDDDDSNPVLRPRLNGSSDESDQGEMSPNRRRLLYKNTPVEDGACLTKACTNK